MGLSRNMLADLIKVQLHSLCVGGGQDQSRTGSTLRAYGAEQIGILIALICGQTRPRSLLRPDADTPILLSDAGFVLEPHLNWRAIRQVGYVRCQGVGEVFLKASITCGS
jgi:hypothetical protein